MESEMAKRKLQLELEAADAKEKATREALGARARRREGKTREGNTAYHPGAPSSNLEQPTQVGASAIKESSRRIISRWNEMTKKATSQMNMAPTTTATPPPDNEASASNLTQASTRVSPEVTPDVTVSNSTQPSFEAEISNNDQQATLIEQQQTSSLQQIISQSLTADAVDWDIAPTPPSIFYNKDKPAQALITQDKTVNPVITTPVLSDEVMWTPAKSSVSITVAPEVSSQIGFLVSQISLPNTETGVNTVQDQVAKRIVNAIGYV